MSLPCVFTDDTSPSACTMLFLLHTHYLADADQLSGPQKEQTLQAKGLGRVQGGQTVVLRGLRYRYGCHGLVVLASYSEHSTPDIIKRTLGKDYDHTQLALKLSHCVLGQARLSRRNIPSNRTTSPQRQLRTETASFFSRIDPSCFESACLTMVQRS